MNKPSHLQAKRRLRGVGLVDVLIGLVVISVGVVGLARFQAVVMKEGGGAKARSVAVQLARAKLDDLRGFTQIEAGANGIFGYDEIAGNAGGAENADGTRRLPAGSVTVSNVAYSRSWTSTPYYLCGNNVSASAANCTPAKTRPDYKALAVTIGWTDADGSAQSLVLNDTASSVDPLSGALALISASSGSPPIVTYIPGQAPQVIAINVGDGQHKETTNPTPTLNKKGQTVINTIARYETVRHGGDDNTITREQFVTLNCSCTQLGTGTGVNLAGAEVGKRVGEAADQFQAFECDICCRDHHDDASCDMSSDTGKNNCYDPYRPVSDFDSSLHDHNHYTANGQLANGVGDTYVESCRLKRIDGYLRVVQDWRLLKLNAIPQSYFAPGGTPSASHIEAYGTYVKNYVAAVISGGSLPSGGWSSSETVAKNATEQLNARGIYLDYMDNATKAEWAARIAEGDDSVFQTLPFYEVNLTKLAKWSSADTSIATVSDDQVVTEAAGQNLYGRGLVRGINTGTTPVTARARVSNTGVINEFITSDPDDGAVVQNSAVSVTVPGVTYAVTGAISGLSSSADVTVSGVGSGGSSNFLCSFTSGADTYSCAVPSGWSGAITPAATGYSFTPAVVDLSNLAAARSGVNFVASTVVTSTYTISGTVSAAVGTATVSAIGSAGNADGSCSYDGVSGAYSCTVPSGWSGSVIVSACGYSFNPGAYVASNVSGNLSADFSSAVSTATSHTISGTIIAAPTTTTVAVNAVGNGTASCTYTMASGAYSCTVQGCWAGTVTPAAGAGISFSPASYQYTQAVSSDLGNQNFNTSYTISGSVALAITNAIVSGVTFTATGSAGSGNGSCSYTDAAGTYACVVPGLWNGSVSPRKTGYSFLPLVRTYSNVTSPYVTENYAAVAVPVPYYTITTTITGLKLQTARAAAIQQVTGLSCGSALVSGSGSNRTATIICTVQGGWNGAITPSLGSGSTVSPLSRSFSDVSANQTAAFSCSGSC